MQDKPDKNIILYNFLYTIFKRQRLVLVLGVATFVLVVIGTWLAAPGYDAESKVLVRALSQPQTGLFEDLTTPVRDNPKTNPAANFIQVLYSRDLAEEVVKEFKLDQRLKLQKTESRSSSAEDKEFRLMVRNGVLAVLTAPIKAVQAVLGLTPPPTNYFEQALESFTEDACSFDVETATQVIVIRIREQDPVKASDIANFMARALVAKSAELDQSTSRKAAGFTDQKLQDAEEDLRAAELELLAFSTAESIVDLPVEKTAKLEQMARIEEDLTVLEANLAQAGARLQGMESQISSQRTLLTPAVAVSSSPTIARLKERLNTLEADLAGSRARLASMDAQVARQKGALSPGMVVNSNQMVADLRGELFDLESNRAAALENFAPDSKTLKQLNAQIAEKQNQLKGVLEEIMASENAVLETIHRNMPIDYADTLSQATSFEAQIAVVTKEIESEMQEILKNDLAVLNTIHRDLPMDFVQTMSEAISLEARQKVLAFQLDTLRQDGQALVAKEMELERLNRRVEANRDLYTNLLNKFTQLQVQSASESAGWDVNIISKANLPADAQKDAPNWLLNIALGFMASLLLGLGCAFFVEYWVESFRSPKEVETRVGLSVLCTLPEISSKTLKGR